MPRNGKKTKTQILDAAHELVMGYGLAGTSIDQVLAKAQVTKGAFFYHFKTKAALALALVQRYADREAAHLETHMTQAERLSPDPLGQVLIFLSQLQAEVVQLSTANGGCLIASYTYEAEALDVEAREISAQTFLQWRQRLGEKFAAAIAQHPPQISVSAEGLADGLVSTFEGSFVMMRVLQDPQQISQQLTHYRNYIELLFGETHPEGHQKYASQRQQETV